MDAPRQQPERAEVPPAIVERLRSLCGGLPEAVEEQAWVGTRWRIRTKTFAHVLAVDDGWPPAYARAAGTDGPAVVLTFRSTGPDLDALRDAGHPFFKPVWFADIVGLVLEDGDDAPGWDEIEELLTASYCVLAPQALATVALAERSTAEPDDRDSPRQGRRRS